MNRKMMVGNLITIVVISLATEVSSAVIFDDNFSDGTMVNWTIVSQTNSDFVNATYGALRMGSICNDGILGNSIVESIPINIYDSIQQGLYPTMKADFTYSNLLGGSTENYYKQSPVVELKFDTNNFIQLNYSSSSGIFRTYAYKDGIAVVNGSTSLQSTSSWAYKNMHVEISLGAASFTVTAWDRATLTSNSVTYNYSWDFSSFQTTQVVFQHIETINGARNYYIDFDNVVVTGFQPVLAISSENMMMGNAASQGELAITNSGDGTLMWSAVSSDTSWLTISPASGTGDAIVTVTCAANTADAVRSGTITFTSNGQTKKVTVEQAGVGIVNIADYIEDPGFEGTHTSPYETLNRLTPLNGWYELFSLSGFDFYQDGGGERSVVGGTAIAAAEGNSYLRSFVYNNSTTWNGIIAGHANNNRSIDAPIPLIPGKTYAMTFKVSTDVVNSYAGPMDHMLVRVRGTMTWEYYGTQFYYFLSSTTPDGYTTIDLTDGEWTTLTYEFIYNGSLVQNGYLEIEFVRQTTLHSNLCLDAISSSDYPTSLVVTPSALSVTSESGSSTTFDIETSDGWTLTSDSSWLTVDSASGSGNTTITATCTANPNVLSRTGNITIIGSGETQRVSVVQAGAVATVFVDNFSTFDTTRWFVLTSEPAKGNAKQQNGEYIDFFTNSSPFSREIYVTSDGQLALPINAGDTYQSDNNYSNVVLTPIPENFKAVTVKIKGSQVFDDPISYDQFNIVLWASQDNLIKFGFSYYDSTASDGNAGHMIVGGSVETGVVCHTQFGGIDDTVSNANDLVLRVEKNTDGTYKYSISKDNGATMTVVADNIAFANVDGTNIQLPNYFGVYACAGRYTDANDVYDPESNRSVDVLVDAFIVSGPGDANLDGAVDVGDLGILAANYGGSDKTWAQGDFNNDKLVDVGDLGILAANYGTGSSSTLSWEEAYAQAFGITSDVMNEASDDFADTDDAITSSACSSLGLSLIVGLTLLGLTIVKLDE